MPTLRSLPIGGTGTGGTSCRDPVVDQCLVASVGRVLAGAVLGASDDVTRKLVGGGGTAATNARHRAATSATALIAPQLLPILCKQQG